MEIRKEITFRPGSKPVSSIPFGIRSAGRYIVRAGWEEKRNPLHFAELFFPVSGKGGFLLDDEIWEVEPGQVFIYLPGMEHCITAISSTWEYRWITFEGEHILQVLQSWGLEAGVMSADLPDIKIFSQLDNCLRDPSQKGEREAAALGARIMAAVTPVKPETTTSPRIKHAIQLIEKNWWDSDFDINTLASRLTVHRSSLTRQFTAGCGISPGRYLQNIRIQNAYSLLRSTAMSVAEVSEKCGYKDPNYFSRIFSQATGQTPRSARQG